MLENRLLELGTSRALLAQLKPDEFAEISSIVNDAERKPRATLDLSRQLTMTATHQHEPTVIITDQYRQMVEERVMVYARFLESQDLTAFDEVNHAYHSWDPVLYIHDLWLECRDPEQFRPCTRSQGFYSFCIWLAVPYSVGSHVWPWPMIQDRTGSWHLHYTSPLGGSQVFHLPVDEEFAGMIMVWPSRIAHTEYPAVADQPIWQLRGNLRLRSTGP
jgi:hypothetical protein